jgi:hypothetical protein
MVKVVILRRIFHNLHQGLKNEALSFFEMPVVFIILMLSHAQEPLQ